MTSHLPPSVSEGLPPWRVVDLPGRGPLRIRDSGAPPGGVVNAPVVLLLHGWTVSADLNWCRVYAPLAERFRVIAWDHHGHGAHGLRYRRRFRLEHCADDAAALLRTVGIDRAAVVGYSMGGAIAQLLWRRHPHLVSALVLGASAMRFGQTFTERRYFALMRLATGPSVVLPGLSWRVAERIAERMTEAGSGAVGSSGASDFDRWAVEEVRAGDLQRLLQAGTAVGRFDSSAWIGGLDVPGAVLVGIGDSVVPTARQRQLAAALPRPFIAEFAGGHAAPVSDPELFLVALLAALDSVTDDRYDA